MNLALFYDTETTGLPLFREPSEHPDQPHIVQLGACLVDLDTRRTVSSLDVIVRPDGWTIPAEVSAIHGITTEMAMDVGISELAALDMFMDLWAGRLRIGHNEQFDARILRIAQLRYGNEEAEAWQEGKAQCTATLATPLCKLPPTEKMRAAGRHHYKTANLGEAHQILVGRPLENAHSAMDDVQGCMAVYFAIQDLARSPAAA